jgi:hypothetical protein
LNWNWLKSPPELGGWGASVKRFDTFKTSSKRSSKKSMRFSALSLWKKRES